MATSKRDNPFLLPKRDGSAKYKSEFSRKKLKQWVDRMPVSDVQKAASDLYGKLDHLNVIDISPASRFEILELLQPSINYILDALKGKCTEGAFPLDLHRRMTAGLRLGILVQVVKVYKTVLSQLHDAAVTGAIFHRQTKAEALRGTVFYLGEVLLHSYTVYQPCVSYAWKELHGIYYYAVQNELTGDAGAGQDKLDRLGVDGLYKQILLLALANPRSLLKGEAERVKGLLQELVAFVDLAPIDRSVSAESFYIIDAQSDEMPCAPNLQKDSKVKVGWLLVTDALSKILEKKISSAEASHNSMRPTDAEALRLKKKLRDSWSNQIRPRELRNPMSDEMELICGLDSMYQVHGGEEPSDTDLWRYQLSMALYGSGYYAIDSPILDNEEVLIEIEPGTLEPYHFNKGPAWHKPKKDQIKIDGKGCVALNRSEHGCRLNWPDSGDGGTHVGELVGINSKGSNGDFSGVSFGVIRWLHAGQLGFLDMGVELFKGSFEPVILQCEHGDTQSTEKIRGFLQHTNSGNTASLITPPFYVAENDHVRVITDSDDIPVNITNIIESTDSFVRFDFERSSEAISIS